MAYSEAFDLVHRREASGPNAIWQADHSPLDILLVRPGDEPGKPWLTIVIDDYSRAVAGYLLSFEPPSTLQTSLALRQGIWRKGDPRWNICGIPGRVVHRPRQRLHLSSSGTGWRGSQDTVDLFDAGKTARPRSDRAILLDH